MAGFLDTLFGGGAEKEAADKDIFALQGYQRNANDALKAALTQGRTDLGGAIGAYAPLAELGKTYSSGAPTYMAALGIGSPAAVSQAQSTFQNSPGFKAMLDNAAQAVSRQRAVGGMGQSGNADIDAMMAAAGLTSDQYQKFISNLGTAGQMGLNATGTAAGGQAGGYTGLANLEQNYGQNQAGVYGNVASGTIGANNLQAAGEAAGAKNLLGAGLSLATLGMGMNPFGGAGGGSSLLGSLGSLGKLMMPGTLSGGQVG